MSFILDALRKSEHARDRRLLPGIRERPLIEQRPHWLPWLLIAIGLLLAVNVGVLIYVLRRPAPPPSTTPPISAPTPTQPIAPSRVSHAIVRPLAAEGGDTPVVEASAPESRPVAHAAAPSPPSAPPSNPRGGDTIGRVTGLPSIRQLPPQATAGLPELNMELHVYAVDSGQRFVFINGQRLQEGGSTRDGVVIEAITPAGAVLRYQGTRFTLP